MENLSLREKCPYSELYKSACSHIQTEYGEILRISPYLVRMCENEDKNNSEYRHFLCSVYFQSNDVFHLLNNKCRLLFILLKTYLKVNWLELEEFPPNAMA